MGNGVLVAYRKFDGKLHYNVDMIRLGEDEHGTWLGAPLGTRVRKGLFDGFTPRWASVKLVPEGQSWWTASFITGESEVDIYCDVTTPPAWSGDDEVTMADLDLDVVRDRATGLPSIVDQDEFAEHQVTYGYPADVIAAAEAAAEWLHASISAGSGPFGGAHLPWQRVLDAQVTARR
ncbi:DUF402 domain-containing protein [Longispora albida]|uniref:DUF402 domain-containing protein n=1 Tax=Longispora albida TaxID=203523 RepID=UPI0003658B84|nr:DUF402 domain-containing protein [Longispora albida]